MYTLAIWLPYLWARVKETTNTARARSQIKTNSLMAHLFTQEINPFELCTIYTTLLVGCCYFFKQKRTQASLVSLRGPAVGAGGLTQVRETETQLESNLLQVSPRWGAVLILALASSPYQQILSFFQTCWLRSSLENWGRRRGEKREREKERGEETAPGLGEDIVCMCTQAQGLWPAA